MSEKTVMERLGELEGRLAIILDAPQVKFVKLNEHAVLPEYKSEEAAGMDLVASEDVTIWSDSIKPVPTGLAMELPPGFEAQIRTRSGLALKALTVANSPGTVDSDYRGEVKVLIHNHGETCTVKRGDRVAQLVIARVFKAQVVEVGALSKTARGAGGFGSTGLR